MKAVDRTGTIENELTFCTRRIGPYVERSEIRKTGRKIISFMHISFDGFVAGLDGEMNRVDE